MFETITWFVVFLCGPTDCFPHAAFVDKTKAKEWGIANSKGCDGYLIKEMNGEKLSKLTSD